MRRLDQLRRHLKVLRQLSVVLDRLVSVVAVQATAVGQPIRESWLSDRLSLGKRNRVLLLVESRVTPREIVLESGKANEDLLKSSPGHVEVVKVVHLFEVAQSLNDLREFNVLNQLEVDFPPSRGAIRRTLVLKAETLGKFLLDSGWNLLCLLSRHVDFDRDLVAATVSLKQIVGRAIAHDTSVDHDRYVVAELFSFVHPVRRH